MKGDITRYLLHPWVYSNNIINGDAEKGDCVEVYTTNKKFLGSAIYNPDSSISLRFYSRDKEELDYLAIKKRIITALKRRRLFFGEADSFRVVFSESDMLPGLIIDKYGDGVVVQINSYGMEKRRRDVFNAILDVLNPVFLYEKSTSYARLQEKLKPREKLIFKKFEDLNLSEYIIEEDGIKIMVDIEKGQKTGYFLDQHIITDSYDFSPVLEIYYNIKPCEGGECSVNLEAEDIQDDAGSFLKIWPKAALEALARIWGPQIRSTE